MIANRRFNLGDIVFLVTDEEQHPRMITAYKRTLDGGLIYYLTRGQDETLHYDQEIATECDVIKKFT